MPPIESWHVARWIALFESQITGRFCAFHLASRRIASSYRRRTTYIVLSSASPFPLDHFVLRGGASTSVVPFQRAARQFATCLRSCDPLSFSSSPCRVTGISNLMSTTTKSATIEIVKCRGIDGSIKHPCYNWLLS